MDVPRIVVFLVLTGCFAAISRKSLGSPAHHGFWRFFAFELLAALVLLAAPSWFVEPLSLRQLCSWVLLIASAYLALAGYLALRSAGPAPLEEKTDALYGFERTSRLVTRGPYALIRHPMYTSLLALGAGAFLKHIAPVETALLAGAAIFLTMTARREERENIARFGDAYREYMERTRMFVPYLW